MTDQPSVQDRLDIQELLGRYVWLLDIGDVEGVVGLFTPDGAIQTDRKSTRLNSSHVSESRMPSSA